MTSLSVSVDSAPRQRKPIVVAYPVVTDPAGSADPSKRVKAAFEQYFETASQSASVTFLGVEPMTVLRLMARSTVVFAGCGTSRYPMGDPGEVFADPVQGPRGELYIEMAAREGTVDADFEGVHKSVAILAAAPAVEGLVYTDGALIDLGAPLWQGAAFTAVLLESSDIADIALPDPASDIEVFRAVPIAMTEAALVRIHGADAVRDAWSRNTIDVSDPHRRVLNSV